jgi:RNA polymerase sigma-70 factor (ECF subfamily)
LEDSNTIDIILWSKLKDGNSAAIGSLYDKYVDELFRYGIQFTADKSKVMDCIHDLFLNLFKYRKNLAHTKNIKYYLLRSLKNEILKKTTANFILNSIAFNDNVQDKDFYTSIEDDLIAEEIVDDRAFQLNQALNSLTIKQRHVLFLRFNEEKKYIEIAEILGVSVETSRTIIYRAIKTLRKSMLFIISVFF